MVCVKFVRLKNKVQNGIDTNISWTKVITHYVNSCMTIVLMHFTFVCMNLLINVL